jgi:hypothetical protein
MVNGAFKIIKVWFNEGQKDPSLSFIISDHPELSQYVFSFENLKVDLDESENQLYIDYILNISSINNEKTDLPQEYLEKLKECSEYIINKFVSDIFESLEGE